MRKSRFNSLVTTHPDNLNKFPYLSRLHQLGDGENPENYFSVLTEGNLRPGDERQFIEWENQIAGLDHSSRTSFLNKAGSVVSVPEKNGRGWHQLVEIFNEIKGYARAVDLGYDCVRFINDNSQSLPDIEASGAPGDCIIEVKTINESAVALSRMGKVEKGVARLSDRLRSVLSERYEKARSQVFNHPLSARALRICFFVIDVDLPMALKPSNKEVLHSYLDQITTDVEIDCISRHWPCNRNERVESVSGVIPLGVSGGRCTAGGG